MNYTNKIGIGTVQFGLDYGVSNKEGKTTLDEVSNILSLCKEHGIYTVDTAEAYGNAEVILGKFNIDNFNIVSKYVGATNSNIDEKLKSTLKKLNVDRIYAYLAHRPEEVLKDLDIWYKLEEKKSTGKINKIGFSYNTVEEVEITLDANVIPDIIQVPFNFLDRRFEKIAIALKEKHNVEIHTRSTYLQGLFFCNPNNLSNFFDEVKPIIKKLQSEKKHLANSLLKFSLDKNFIDKVIIGINNSQQLKENLNLNNAETLLDNELSIIKQDILMPSNWPKR